MWAKQLPKGLCQLIFKKGERGKKKGEKEEREKGRKGRKRKKEEKKELNIKAMGNRRALCGGIKLSALQPPSQPRPKGHQRARSSRAAPREQSPDESPVSSQESSYSLTSPMPQVGVPPQRYAAAGRTVPRLEPSAPRRSPAEPRPAPPERRAAAAAPPGGGQGRGGVRGKGRFRPRRTGEVSMGILGDLESLGVPWEGGGRARLSRGSRRPQRAGNRPRGWALLRGGRQGALCWLQASGQRGRLKRSGL